MTSSNQIVLSSAKQAVKKEAHLRDGT